MEPEFHEPDRRAARAARVDREVEAMLAAAARRRVFAGGSGDPAHGEFGPDPTVVEVELAETRAQRDELQARLAIAESEREAVNAELRTLSDRAADLDRQLRAFESQEGTSEFARTEDEAAGLLLAAARAADDVRDASRARALRTLTKARDLAALVHAETEREREALSQARERRAEVENEVQAILTEAHVTAEGVVAAIVAERRVEAENEAAEILAQAHTEADGLFTSVDDERRRVCELLAAALASLDVESTARHEDLVADLESRLHETTDPPVP